MKLLPSRRVLCTPYNHAPRHFMQRHNPLQDLSYSYAPHVCRTVHTHTLDFCGTVHTHAHDFCGTVHTHTLQTAAGQVIPIHSRLLQDSSYPYTPGICKTVHTHTVQTSAGQFIPIYSRLLKEQFIPLHFARQFSPASSSNSYVPTSFRHVILCFDWLNA